MEKVGRKVGGKYVKHLFLATKKESLHFYITSNADIAVKTAAQETAVYVNKITGVTPLIKQSENFADVLSGVCFALFSETESLLARNKKAQAYQTQLLNTDGFAVVLDNATIYVLSHTPSGVYYGAHDFLEKNADIVWGRGAKEYDADYLPSEEIEICCYDYAEASPFAVRVWNACGKGSEGKDHLDDGTAKYYAKNKINGMFHAIEPYWNAHGLRGVGITVKANNIDDLETEHPEYFMTDIDGTPKTHAAEESFVNYYNEDAAKTVAKRFVDFLQTADKDTLYSLIMPDSPYFYVKENGKVLSELPFTADDGTVVQPSDKNYKSTVYFNYMNRVVREINRLRPNTDVLTFAYLYSEEVPAIQTDEHLIVSLAPIYTNEKYAYTDRSCEENAAIAANIEKWSEKCKKLCVYSYWNSFRGTIYMRPILRQIQEDLRWFRKLQVYGITAEGKLDCSLTENASAAQTAARKFFDMNEACTWVVNKLVWNPDQDPYALLTRYAKIVYKEVAQQFLQYYRLIESGFDSQNAYVWYPTGGDVYILQFIVNAGIKDEVLSVLEEAKKTAVSPTVKSRISSIYEIVQEQIKKYADFVKEEATITVTDKTEAEILSEQSLDYKNNPQSVWNEAVPIKVLRDYNTMAFYDPAAQFECRMLYDGTNIYIGYSVQDDTIAKRDTDENGHIRVLRENGERLISYAETYIGGNELNQSTYYGYLSGFRESKENNAFYRNSGAPSRIKEDKGLADTYFVKLSENPEERYYVHVQKIPISALGSKAEDFTPYGSFVYYTNRYGRAGWMGFGLWSKQNFQSFQLRRKSDGSTCNNT